MVDRFSFSIFACHQRQHIESLGKKPEVILQLYSYIPFNRDLSSIGTSIMVYNCKNEPGLSGNPIITTK